MNGIELDKKMTVNIGLRYGSKMLRHLRNAPPVPHSTMTVTVTIMSGKKAIQTLKGVSYCSPYDSFNAVKGFKTALARALQSEVSTKGSKPIMTRARRTMVYQSVMPKLKQITNPKKKIRMLAASN